MVTMIVKQEVEATPKLVVDLLTKHAAKMANARFPWSRGDKLILLPQCYGPVNAIPDMPAMVISSQQGTPLGMVALCQVSGDITMAFVTETQVLRVWNPD